MSVVGEGADMKSTLETTSMTVTVGLLYLTKKHVLCCCGAVCASFRASCSFSGGALTRRERRPRRDNLSREPPPGWYFKVRQVCFQCAAANY